MIHSFSPFLAIFNSYTLLRQNVQNLQRCMSIGQLKAKYVSGDFRRVKTLKEITTRHMRFSLGQVDNSICRVERSTQSNFLTVSGQIFVFSPVFFPVSVFFLSPVFFTGSGLTVPMTQGVVTGIDS